MLAGSTLSTSVCDSLYVCFFVVVHLLSSSHLDDAHFPLGELYTSLMKLPKTPHDGHFHSFTAFVASHVEQIYIERSRDKDTVIVVFFRKKKRGCYDPLFCLSLTIVSYLTPSIAISNVSASPASWWLKSTVTNDPDPFSPVLSTFTLNTCPD